MKKRIPLFIPAILGIALLVTAFGGVENSDRPNGSPGGYTGSPGDGRNCTDCHGGSASNVTGWITSNIPADGYTPGATYTITATATGTGNKGFEISPQTLAGGLLGSLTPGSGNKLCNSNKAITHSAAVGGSSATWTFSWTAPAAGTGSVTFYGAFVVTKPVTKLTTMVVNEAAAPLSATATATPSSICAGNASQLGVTVGGGNPPYAFSWTSNPAGFTSTSQSPSVTPSATTTYTVQVGDGTSSVTSSVTITVIQPPVVSAGNDTTYCIDVVSIPLTGHASNSTSVGWTTSGDGTFSTTTALSSIYYPGTGDRTNGFVNLYLTATPVSPCSGNVSAGRHIILETCTGIAGKAEASVLTIAPNPTEGLISLSGFNSKPATITLFNLNGQQILSTKTHPMNNTAVQLNLESYPKGVYYIKVQTDEFIKTQKVILR
jgi:hypothetical protein